MLCAMFCSSMVLPAFGGATIRPRWPRPIGDARSSTRAVKSSVEPLPRSIKMMGIESCGMLLSAVNNLKDSEDEELHLLMVDNHIPAGAKLY